MADLIIRRAELSDADALARLYAHAGTYSGTLQLPYPSAAMWRGRLERPPEEVVALVALIDGELVGQAGLHMEKNVRRRHAAHIGIGVADPFAGKGVGTALMAELINLADNWLQLLRLELTVFVDNQAAQGLYRKFGFEVEGTHRAYALRNGVLMDVHAMARLHPQQPSITQSVAQSVPEK